MLATLLLIVAAVPLAHCQQLFEGAECPNQAVCRRVTECVWAQREVQNHRVPQRCGWAGYQPLVCCPDQSGGDAGYNIPFMNAGFSSSPFGGGSSSLGGGNGAFNNNPFLNGGFTTSPFGNNGGFTNRPGGGGNGQFSNNPFLSSLGGPNSGGFSNRPTGSGNGGLTNRPTGSGNGGFSNRPTGSGNGGFSNRPNGNGNGGFTNRPTGNGNGGFTNRPNGNGNGGFTNRPNGNGNGGFTNRPNGNGNGGFTNRPSGTNRPTGGGSTGSAGLVDRPHWESTSQRPSTTTGRPTFKPAVGQRGKIARKKCVEYAEYVFREDESYVLSPLAVGEKINQCAFPGEVLIVGGERANAKEFPHMALIGYGEEDSIEYQCGGSLVAPDFVLTAAHCLVTPGGMRARWVLLGELDRSTDTDDAKPQLLEIREATKHPNYKPPEHYFDIALLRLKRAANMNEYVRPACLNTEKAIHGKDPLATGWGHTEWAGDPSDRLMKVSLPLQPYRVCNESYRNSGGRQLPRGILDDTQLCAGDLKGGKDTCQGDSGGPLQIFTTEKPFYCMHHIIGITSFGKACGFKNSPAIYTRVSAFVPWIESVVWPNQ